MIKICTNCKENKHLDDFYASKNGKFGKTSRCKLCKNLEAKKWAKNNPKRAKEIDNKRRRKHRDVNLERSKEYYKKNKEELKVRRKKYREDNKQILREKKKVFYINNKEKIASQGKKWRDANKTKQKNKRYIKQYGITYDFYLDICQKLENKCQICNNYSKKLVVDHCHITNEYRGLLCSPCNTGIGHLKESIKSLKKAVIYLENFDERET